MGGRRERLAAWIAENVRERRVEMHDFDALLTHLGPVSEPDLRRLLRESGAELHPLAAGVDQEDFPALRTSLERLAEFYEAGDAAARRAARAVVITAKDHAKLAARNTRVAEDRRAEKAQMVEWMLTWLENPAVFPLWIRLKDG